MARSVCAIISAWRGSSPGTAYGATSSCSIWSQSLRFGAAAGGRRFAHHLRATDRRRWRAGPSRGLRIRARQGGAVFDAGAQIAQGLKRGKILEQPVGMEIVDLAECQGHFGAAERQAQRGRHALHHFVEIVAVDLDRPPVTPRAAAEIARHQDAERRLGLGMGDLSRLFGDVDLHRC